MRVLRLFSRVLYTFSRVLDQGSKQLMESLLELTRQRLIVPFLIILTAIFMLSPLASNALVPNSVDVINHLAAIIQAKMALQEGQFPLRVMPHMFSGWRYPFYQFYSPSAYLPAGALFMLTPWNPFITFKLMIFLSSILGGFYLYRLANILVNSQYLALLTSVAYLTSPYYLIVIDHLYDFTEALALGVLPVTLYYTMKLFYYPKHLPTFLLMALFWYLLATVHIITFIYTFLFAAFLFTVFTCLHRRYWRHLMWLAGGFLLAIMLAAWYLLPVLALEKVLMIHNYFGNYQFRSSQSVSLTTLFAPLANIWPMHISTDPKKVENMIFLERPNVGMPFMFAMAMSCYIYLKRKSINTAADAWFLPLFLTALIILIFIWEPVNFWSHVPNALTVGQYSWRLLAEFSWVASLLFAISLAYLFPSGTLSKKTLLITFFCVVLATSSWYRVPDLSYTYADFTGMINDPVGESGSDAYMPNPVKLLSFSANSLVKPPEIITLKQSQQFCHQDKDITKCALPSFTATKVIQLPIIYYPKLLSITVNGKKVPYHGLLYQGKRILVAIETVPNIVNNVEIQFKGLVYANKISTMCWCLWLMLWLYQTRRYFVSLFSKKQELTLCAK